MKRLVLASCAAFLTLAPVLALAQSRTPPSGATSSGSASPRGGESTSSAPSSSGSSSGTSSGSVGSSSSSSAGGGGYYGGSTVSRPAGVSRANAPRNGDTYGAAARPRSEAHGTTGVGQPVPAETRPRGDRQPVGAAIPRSAKPDNTPNWNGYPYGTYGSSGYGYYGYYPDCTYYGYYCGAYYPWYYYGWSPWGAFGWANPYAWSPFTADWYDWMSPGYAGGYSARYSNPDNGSIKFKVKPKQAEIYVDGYFEGPVDAYDGAFQHLDLKGGMHHVEIRATGYETLTFDIRVMPGRTVTYTGDLKAAPVK